MVKLEAAVKALRDISQQGVWGELLPVASLSPETKIQVNAKILVWSGSLNFLY